MEDFALDLMLGKGATAREYRMPLPPFTVVGATPPASPCSPGPLRDRFGAHFRLDFYEEDELCQVLQRAAAMQDYPLDEAATRNLARRARGYAPRWPCACCAAVHDFATTRANGHITTTVAEDALALLCVDELGMEELDRRILHLLAEKIRRRPGRPGNDRRRRQRRFSDHHGCLRALPAAARFPLANAARARADAQRLRTPRPRISRRFRTAFAALRRHERRG